MNVEKYIAQKNPNVLSSGLVSRYSLMVTENVPFFPVHCTILYLRCNKGNPVKFVRFTYSIIYIFCFVFIIEHL